MAEAPRTDALVLARELASAVRAALPNDGKPFAFLGFAFGAIVAHETAVEMGLGRAFSCIASPIPTDRPALVCAVSSEGPSWAGRRTEMHKLDSAAFEDALRRKGGTEEILAERDLIEIFLPVVQADVKIEEVRPPSLGSSHLPSSATELVPFRADIRGRCHAARHSTHPRDPRRQAGARRGAHERER